MRRATLIRRIAVAAHNADRDFRCERQGRAHELWRCGETLVTIPRHREIARFTAEAVMRQLEAELGRRWWR